MRSLGLLSVFACMLCFQELITVKLTPGVTTTLKRSPAGLRETVAFTASAGQTLLVELNIEALLVELHSGELGEHEKIRSSHRSGRRCS